MQERFKIYRNNIIISSLLTCCAIVFSTCVKPFIPPALQAKNNYLVVDGFINTSPNQITTINLTRTRSITDSTFTTENELGASIQIKSNDGEIYPLTETGNGNYSSAALSLDNSKQYQVLIKTSNGKEYNSDYTNCLQTPAIDSVTWEQPGDVIVYLYTHDDNKNIMYYKWDYEETWQYNSIFRSTWGIDQNNFIHVLHDSDEIDSCWESDLSNQILLGNSVNLSSGVINKAKITTVPFNDLKIFVRYSILVKQHALTGDAYKYWQIVEKNSQDRGGLFDVEPWQLEGNIHAQTDLTEPVIGFVNASSESDYRIFINNRELNGWSTGPNNCDIKTIPQDPHNFQNWYYQDTAWLPYFFSGSDIVITRKICIDCRSHGGTTKRPSYW